MKSSRRFGEFGRFEHLLGFLPLFKYQSYIFSKRFLVRSPIGLECLTGIERLNGYGPLCNYFCKLFDLFLVLPKECLETLKCLKSLEYLGLLSDYLQHGRLSRLLLVMTYEG